MCHFSSPPDRFAGFPALQSLPQINLISLQNLREEAGDVEEVRERNLSGGYQTLVHVFFDQVL